MAEPTAAVFYDEMLVHQFVTDDQMVQPWSLKQGAQVFFTLPKAAVLRSFVMNHSIHHRGELVVYLRLNDIPVPGVYGPSADESM